MQGHQMDRYIELGYRIKTDSEMGVIIFRSRCKNYVNVLRDDRITSFGVHVNKILKIDDINIFKLKCECDYNTDIHWSTDPKFRTKNCERCDNTGWIEL